MALRGMGQKQDGGAQAGAGPVGRLVSGQSVPGGEDEEAAETMVVVAARQYECTWMHTVRCALSYTLENGKDGKY